MLHKKVKKDITPDTGNEQAYNQCKLVQQVLILRYAHDMLTGITLDTPAISWSHKRCVHYCGLESLRSF